MKKFLFVAASLAGAASAAQAGGCDSPFCQGQRGLFGGHGGRAMPAFQAAPWYLYWPYNQHFMTPSPMQGAYSAPPMGYGGVANPYFPAHGGPAGGYGYPPAAPAAPAPMPAVSPPAVSAPAVPGILRTSGRR